MDETQIAQNLAQNTPQSPPETQPVYPDAEPGDPEALKSGLPIDNLLTRMEVMDYFNVPKMMRSNPDTQAQMDTIIGWARENGGQDLNDIFSAISHQEAMMGIRFKEDRLGKLYRYVRLNKERMAVEHKMRTLYGS